MSQPLISTLASKTMVIIPTYNEVGNIGSIIATLLTLYPSISITVVDDNSIDGTADVVRSIQQRAARVYLLSRPNKTGLGDAYKEAFELVDKRSDIDFIVTMDADGSHDPTALECLLRAITNADMVVGSRYVAGGMVVGWSLRRRLLSYFGNRYVGLMLGAGIRDMTAGFMVIKRSFLRRIDLAKINSGGYAYLIELKYQSRLINGVVKEISITFKDRAVGSSKMTLAIAIEGVLLPLKIIFGLQ